MTLCVPTAADRVAAVLAPELGGGGQSDGAPSHACLLHTGNSPWKLNGESCYLLARVAWLLHSPVYLPHPLPYSVYVHVVSIWFFFFFGQRKIIAIIDYQT